MFKYLKYIFFFFLIALSTIWIFVIPPLQTPDEQAHLRYIQFIYENKRLPNGNDIKDNEILETSDSIEKLIEENQADRIFHNRNYHFDFENPEPTDIEGFNAAHLFNHPPFYYLWSALVYLIFSSQSLLTILFAIRLSNLVFIGLNFVYAYKVSKLLSKNKWFQILLPVFITFWPGFLFGNIGINSDVSLFTSFIATIYYLLKIYKSKEVEKLDLLKLSLWIVIGSLSKAQFLTLVPFAVFYPAFRIFKKFDLKKGLIFFAPLIIPAAYFLRNLFTFGHLFPNPSGPTGIVRDNFYQGSSDCSGASVLHYIKTLIYPRLVYIFKGFVGNLGWLDTQFPNYVYYFIAVLFLTGFVLFSYYLFKNIGKKNIKQWIVIIIPIVCLEIFYIYLYLSKYMKSCYPGFPAQGRYYFPLILPVFAIVLFGLNYVVPKRFKDLLSKVLIVFVLFLSSYALVMVIQRYDL